MEEDRIDLIAYANEVPKELRFAMKGLEDDTRIGIIVAFLKHGRMTFSQMEKRFNMSASSLTNHLKILTQASLIQNYYEKSADNKYSFYDLTEFCQSLLKSLYEVVSTSSTKLPISFVRPEIQKKETKPEQTGEVFQETAPVTQSSSGVTAKRPKRQQ